MSKEVKKHTKKPIVVQFADAPDLNTIVANAVAIEIEFQLENLRIQLYERMRVDIDNTVTNEVARALTLYDKKINKKVSFEIKSEMKKSNQEDTTNNMQLSVINEIKQQNNKAIITMGNNIQRNVYNQVMDKIGETIIPSVNSMIERVNYNMQDGNEIVDSYRRAYESETNKVDAGMRMLTNTEKQDKRIISNHVRTFFDDDSDSY